MSGKSRLGTAVGGCLAALLLALPQTAAGGVIGDVVGGVQETVDQTVDGVLGGAGAGGSASGGLGAGAAPAPAPTPAAGGPETEPVISGGNPHAQGQVLDVDVDQPLLPDLGVTVGESRGEQDDDGNYRGVVKVISVTGLGAPVELGIETQEGENASGPLGPINDGLDDLCTASSICLAVLDYESETTDEGSQNSFSAARLSVGATGALLPVEAVGAAVLTSRGDISETDDCQTASSSSSAADVGVLSDTINADALNSQSESEACRGEDPEANADSEVVQLNQVGLLGVLGCDEDAVDGTFPPAPLNAVIDGVCNGDDTNGTQAEAPYNVRKALGLDVLPGVFGALGNLVGVRLDAAKSESLARAPEDERPPPRCPDPANPACDEPPPPVPDCPDPNNPECEDAPPREGPGPGPSAGPPAESLPFTGSNLATLGLIGGLVMAAGLGLMGLADRRRGVVG